MQFQEENGSATSLLLKAGVQVNTLKTALNAAIGNLPKSDNSGGEIAISRDLNNLLNITDKLAQKRGDAYIASEMFLLALADDKGATGKLLKANGLTKNALEEAIMAVRGSDTVSDSDAESNREALKKYTLDLTERASLGKLDPVIGQIGRASCRERVSLVV